MACPLATDTIAVIILDARPVDVTHPATVPAIAQATATEIVPFAPDSSASIIFVKVMRSSLLKSPTTIVATIATEAENCIDLVFVDTSTTSSTNGNKR